MSIEDPAALGPQKPSRIGDALHTTGDALLADSRIHEGLGRIGMAGLQAAGVIREKQSGKHTIDLDGIVNVWSEPGEAFTRAIGEMGPRVADLALYAGTQAVGHFATAIFSHGDGKRP